MAHRRKWLAGAAFVVTIAAVLFLIAATGSQSSLAQDGIIYVDAEAPGPTHDGASWETAFTGLQAALDVVGSRQQIWVATGVYTPTQQLDTADLRSATFQMANEVAIYGGFDPSTGATDWEDRDWVLHESILSGDLNGDDGDDFANREDNSYHVFYHPDGTNLDDTATLDGFTISGGNADGDESAQQDAGGGMFNYASSPALTNVTFDGNSAGAGGGMDNTGGSAPTLTGCAFSRNVAADEGGGMHNDGSSPTLIGCTFFENTADAGGGIYNGASSPALTGVTFAGNSANSGGGMHSDGSSPVLINCTFTGNSAAGHGGGMRSKGASAPILTNCTFHSNRAINGTGGAIQNYESSYLTLTNCILWGDSKPEIV
ncbi:MAG: right-handed parallel beta-helix repeat-containing protein, partial [Anaerolineae bacterium]